MCNKVVPGDVVFNKATRIPMEVVSVIPHWVSVRGENNTIYEFSAKEFYEKYTNEKPHVSREHKKRAQNAHITIGKKKLVSKIDEVIDICKELAFVSNPNNGIAKSRKTKAFAEAFGVYQESAIKRIDGVSEPIDSWVTGVLHAHVLNLMTKSEFETCGKLESVAAIVDAIKTYHIDRVKYFGLPSSSWRDIRQMHAAGVKFADGSIAIERGRGHLQTMLAIKERCQQIIGMEMLSSFKVIGGNVNEEIYKTLLDFDVYFFDWCGPLIRKGLSVLEFVIENTTKTCLVATTTLQHPRYDENEKYPIAMNKPSDFITGNSRVQLLDGDTYEGKGKKVNKMIWEVFLIKK